MNEQVRNIPIAQLHPFRSHPFQVKDDEAMVALCDSIREYGILSPLLARPAGEWYEVVSGYRRRLATMKLGLRKLPVLVRDMTDYTVWDKKNYGDPDVSKAAYPKFLEKLEVCRDLFHSFGYATFLTGDDLEKARFEADYFDAVQTVMSQCEMWTDNQD